MRTPSTADATDGAEFGPEEEKKPDEKLPERPEESTFAKVRKANHVSILPSYE